jgi:hypothetical protein
MGRRADGGERGLEKGAQGEIQEERPVVRMEEVIEEIDAASRDMRLKSRIK